MKVLKLVVISAKGLKNVHLVSKMNPFTVMSIAGQLTTRYRPIKTPTDRGRNPVWSFYSEFELPESELRQNHLTVVFQILSKSHLLGGYRNIGKAFVSAKDLLDSVRVGTVTPIITTLPVTTPTGKIHGELTFSYEFCDVVTQENGHEVNINAHAPSTGDCNLLVSGCIAEFLPRVCGTVVGNILSDVL